jgi:hypothetical protein
VQVKCGTHGESGNDRSSTSTWGWFLASCSEFKVQHIIQTTEVFGRHHLRPKIHGSSATNFSGASRLRSFTESRNSIDPLKPRLARVRSLVAPGYWSAISTIHISPQYLSQEKGWWKPSFTRITTHEIGMQIIHERDGILFGKGQHLPGAHCCKAHSVTDIPFFARRAHGRRYDWNIGVAHSEVTNDADGGWLTASRTLRKGQSWALHFRSIPSLWSGAVLARR